MAEQEAKHHHVLSKELFVPISLVFTLLGAAMSYGAMYSKVDSLQNLVELEREDRKEDVAKTNQQVEEIHELLVEVLKKNDIGFNDVGYVTTIASH